MKALLLVGFCALLIAFYENALSSGEEYNTSLRMNKTATFLHYVSAFDSYYAANSTGSGDVSNNVGLPVWLPADSTIRMYISGGNGYVYMPSASGVLSEVMKATDYSYLVGYSDSSSIIMLSGKLPKPSFIPAGYIVYVR